MMWPPRARRKAGRRASRTVTAGCGSWSSPGSRAYVRDPARRQILYDMNRARQKLRDTGADEESLELLVKCYGNLLPMWLDG